MTGNFIRMKQQPCTCNFFRLPALLIGTLIGLWILVTPAGAGNPQNIILMIGDGMGLESVWATGAYQYGADYHKFGGREKLSFEKLSGFSWVTTYPLNLNSSPTNDPRPLVSYDPTWTRGGKPGQLDYPRFGPELTFSLTPLEGAGNGLGNGEGKKSYATDSGSAATSLACGIKTFISAIGMDNFNRPCKNIIEKFHEKGKKAGIVTSVQFSHATPAAFGAHNVNRKNYLAIAEEMVRVVQPEVIMGAGHPGYDGYGQPVPPQYKYISSDDYRFLSREGAAGPYALVEKQEDFLGLLEGIPPGRVFGLVQNSQGLRGPAGNGNGEARKSPSLREMTRGTLRVLSGETPGFFLMIEGGAIDHGHHVNDLNLAIRETLRFQEAVQAVVEWIENPGNPLGGWDKNLLIVTADHETGYLTGIEPQGVGRIPRHTYNSRDHTNRLVGVWYQGAGMEFFQKYLTTMNDFERGPLQYVDNTDIHKVMEDCLQAEPARQPETSSQQPAARTTPDSDS
jgi:alkaline phosphatase